MIAISEVDAEAFETFKREEERFAFIEAVFREEEMAKIANFRAQREDIFASYLKGDQQRWNNLDLLQKISFNVQTEKENQKHALFIDKKIDQAGKNLQLISRQAVKKRRFSVHQKKKAAEKLEITMLERAELELEYWKIEQTKRKELQRLGRMLPQEKKAEAIGDEADSLFKQTASIFPDQGAVFETAWNRVIAKTEEVGKLWENIVNIYFLNLSSASIGTAYNIIKNISLPYAVYSRERWNVEVLLRKAQRISLLADFTLKKAQTVPHDYAQVFETTWRDALNDTSEAKNLWEESLQLQRSGQEYVPSEFQQKWIDLLQHIEQLHEHWKAEISWRNAQKADCIATALKLKATATSHLNKTLFKENHKNALQAALAAEAAWQQVIEAEENGKAVVATKYHEEWNNNILQAKIARAHWTKQIGRSSSQCIIH